MKNSYFENYIGNVSPLSIKNKRYTENLTENYLNENDRFKTIKKYKMTVHAKTRCNERKVTPAFLDDIFAKGIKVWDSDSNRIIYFYRNPKYIQKAKLFVVIIENDIMITIHRLEKARIHKMIKKEFKGFVFYEKDINLI